MMVCPESHWAQRKAVNSQYKEKVCATWFISPLSAQ